MTTEKPAQPESSARLLLACVGFIVTLAGQLAFYLTPEGQTKGVVLGLALSLLGVLVLLVGLLKVTPPWLTRATARLGLYRRAVLVLVAVLLALMTAGTQLLFVRYGRTNFLPVLLLWLAGALTYVIAFVDRGPTWPAVRGWLVQHRRELVMLGVITLLAAGVRTYRLGDIPRVIDGDEGRVGQAALTAQNLPLANPFALWENFGGIYMQTIGLSLNTLGVTPFALRLAPAILGSLAVPATYLLGRAILGPRGGLVAAALLAISHAHIHFSRIVSVAYIAETLLVPLELYFFLTGMRARQAWRLAVGGLILGAHFSVYVSAPVIFAMLLMYIVVALLVARPVLRGAGRLILVFWLGVLITAAPQAAYAWSNPDEFMARMNADGTFQSGWLDREIASTGKSPVQILAGRVVHAFLVLNHLPAIDFYGARIPLLDIITGSLFIFGIVYSLWRTRDSGCLLLNGYFWSLTLAIAIFAIPPTADSYRMLVALPAAILLAAAGLEQGLVILSLAGLERRGARQALVGCVLASALVLNSRAYFVDFALRCRYGGDRATRFASYLGSYLKTVDPETVVYLLSDQELQFGTHGSADFLSDGSPVTNWTAPVGELAVNANTVVLAGSPRHDELRAWARLQPAGELTHITDCERPMLLVYEAAATP